MAQSQLLLSEKNGEKNTIDHINQDRYLARSNEKYLLAVEGKIEEES